MMDIPYWLTTSFSATSSIESSIEKSVMKCRSPSSADVRYYIVSEKSTIEYLKQIITVNFLRSLLMK